MKHRVHHGLDIDLARRVTRRALEGYIERFAKYQPRLQWRDDSTAEVAFSALGSTVKGLFELTQDAVLVEMNVPLLLKPFRRRAIDVVEREILDWVAAARRGELDDED